MATLIEPDGTENVSITVQGAIDYCADHPGWAWCYAEDDE